SKNLTSDIRTEDAPENGDRERTLGAGNRECAATGRNRFSVAPWQLSSKVLPLARGVLQDLRQSVQTSCVSWARRIGGLLERRSHPRKLLHFPLFHMRTLGALNRLTQIGDLVIGQTMRPLKLVEIGFRHDQRRGPDDLLLIL